ncbi:MAG: nucleotidyltransferase family protein [Actinomycetota bacterium]
MNWQASCILPGMSLRETIGNLDRSALQIALVTDGAGHLLGTVTDGDIRRAIIRGADLDNPISQVMNPKPFVLPQGTSGGHCLSFMRKHAIHQVPLVDEAGKLVGLVSLDALIGAVERPNPVVLMAGGLGTRLRPLTENCPKPMLMVGGKPILENILESFVEQGFRHFFLAVNYRAEMIQEHFQDGARWGVNIQYLHENQRLGTAGALSLLGQPPENPIIVMNGDLLTRASFTDMLEFHESHGAAATMAIREYDFQVPYGVVRVDGAKIVEIEEKPIQNFYVNAGIYVLSPLALQHIPKNAFFDMPQLFEKLRQQAARTCAFPLREYWIDIGRVEEFERAQEEWIDGGNT